MDLDEAKRIHEQIRSAGAMSISGDLIDAAVRYARVRVDWQLASAEDRIAMEDARTRAHNVFIDLCNILARQMNQAGQDTSWRAALGQDRKRIGDFACHLHCLLGLAAR